MYIDTGLKGCTSITRKPQNLSKNVEAWPKKSLFFKDVALGDIYTACEFSLE